MDEIIKDIQAVLRKHDAEIRVEEIGMNNFGGGLGFHMVIVKTKDTKIEIGDYIHELSHGGIKKNG